MCQAALLSESPSHSMLPPLTLLPNPTNPLLFDALAPIQHFVLVASMGEFGGSAPGIPGSRVS